MQIFYARFFPGYLVGYIYTYPFRIGVLKASGSSSLLAVGSPSAAYALLRLRAPSRSTVRISICTIPRLPLAFGGSSTVYRCWADPLIASCSSCACLWIKRTPIGCWNPRLYMINQPRSVFGFCCWRRFWHLLIEPVTDPLPLYHIISEVFDH
jgi:hypothetical protein